MAYVVETAKKVAESGFEGAVDGLVWTAYEWIADTIRGVGPVYKTLYRTAKQFSEPILFGATGLIAIPAVMGRLPEPASKIAKELSDMCIARALYKILEFYVLKKPDCFVLDEKTIEVYNLDPEEEVEVLIDGKKPEFYETPKTDKNGYAKIVLAVPMDEGTHEIVVHTSKKAWYGKGVV